MTTYEIGAFIRRKSEDKKISQKELAELLGIAPPSLSNIERGLNYPDIDRLFKIAEILQFSFDELLCTVDYCIGVLNVNDSLRNTICKLSPEKRQTLMKIVKTLVEELGKA